MLPTRIILEGKSYLMLDENLGRLNYKPFTSGSINSKYYSDYEALSAVGIALIDTVTKKTVKGKKVEEPDMKFCIKFKWDTGILLNNPNLFLRYFNYFDDTKQQIEGKRTTADFMPFVYQGSYSADFQEILTAGEEEYDYLNEAVEGSSLGLDGFDASPEEDVYEVDPEYDGSGDAKDDFVDNGADDKYAGDDGAAKLKASMRPSKDKDYIFYMVFKYAESYNHADKMRNADYHSGADIEILKLVAEGHADDNNVAITGKALEKKAVGFYRELLGILNANHKTIKRMVEIEENDYNLDDFGGHEEFQLEQPANGGTYDDSIDDEIGNPDIEVPELDASEVNKGLDNVHADLSSKTDISEESFQRFMNSKGKSF